MKYYKDLIEQLNNATKAYDEGRPYMSDYEWDKLYYELVEYEKIHGFSLPDSPTRSIHYEVVNELTKVAHTSPMLSLDKTKSLDELNQFIGGRPCFLSLKLDGLTCRLTYENGRLARAETRGNGVIGEDITHNARVISSIPTKLSVPANVIIDGEIICTDKDFAPFAAEYKNSRNFAAGSIRLLDSKECAKRNLTFVAWEVVDGIANNSATARLTMLSCYSGRFISVPLTYLGDSNSIVDENTIEQMQDKAKCKGYPIDGLVLKYDNIEYGKTLGMTAHHRRDGLAFKFFDESYPTTLKDIEWSMGRTGVLTPVAVFDPIDIDGSTVSRANMFNIGVMYETLQCLPSKNGIQPIVPQIVYVYKANSIIPQISSSEMPDADVEWHFVPIPTQCPCCGGATAITADCNTSVLKCKNSLCEGLLINRLDHFCSKDRGLDIKGLSKNTLEKLIEWGWVSCLLDLYFLHEHKIEWINKPGFGEASVNKILDAIEASRTATLNAFICSLGIPHIGRTISKQLLEIVDSYEDFRNKIDTGYDFSSHAGFGYEKSQAILDFDYHEADQLARLVIITKPEEEKKETTLAGSCFCITGKLHSVKNREELVDIITQHGGKFVKSVSKKVNFLINNDASSTSAKNKEAAALGIPVITEEDFYKMI